MASLAQSAPEAALLQLEGWLIPLGAETRRPVPALHDALHLIDAGVREHYRDATRRVLLDRAQSASPHRALFEIVDSCLARLASMHQVLSVKWMWQGKSALRDAVPPATSFMCAVRICAAVRKWSRLMDREVRPGVWPDLCSLYSAALDCGWASVPCPVIPGSTHTTTVEREWLKAALFAALDAGTLSPEQLDIVERALEFCSEALLLSPRLPFAVDLEAATLPMPRTKCGADTPFIPCFGLDPSDSRLRDLLRQVEAGRISPALFGQRSREVTVDTLRLILSRLD